MRLKAKLTGPVIGAILAVVAGLLLLGSSLGHKLVFLSYDIPFYVRPYIFPTEVEMVYVDEASYNALEQPLNTHMDRAVYARLIDRMTREKAKAVAFDIVFSDANPDKAAADQALIQAVKKNGRVILAADSVPPSQSVPGVKMFNQFIPPFDALEAVTAGVGTAEMYSEDDLINRQHVPFSKQDEYHSLSWAAAAFLGAPITKLESQWTRTRWFNYYGPDKVLPFLSLYQALEVDPVVPDGFFSNKVVFVGQRVFTRDFSDRKDEYPAPFPNLANENKFVPGVEVQATAFLNLLRGDWLNRLSDRTEQVIIIFMGILFGAGLALSRPLAATLWAIAGIGLIALADYFAFAKFHYWFPWLIVAVIQIPLTLVWSIAFNSVQLYVEKKLVEQSLSLYLSPKLVRKFANNPKLLKPGAEKQLLTILFSDIASFTNISEGMDSDDLARSMNDYFQIAVHNCIHATDGTVVKYIGDAIFAFWNAPELQSDHSFRACEAALRFRDQPPQFMNGKELVTRIGLHTGVANVGNFGSMTRVDYTALGENINLASRMEGLNKYTGTRVLLTSDTQEVAGPKIITRYLGLFRLKGFEKAVGVHELTGRLEQEAESRDLRERFARALAALAARDFAAAEAAFQRVLELSPKDGPSLFYLRQIEELRHETLPPDWKGEITLKEK
ncbi:MAG: adenylate/guanylate cyclase domain-containing protein [Verrucomicrobiota bacterium]|jgi:adenylate cyclase